MSTGPAVLAGIGLLLLPGLGLLLWLSREERAALSLDERFFLVPAASVMLASWVGLVLAEAGRFSLTTAGGVGAAAGGLLALAGLWRAGSLARRPLFPRALVAFAALLHLAALLGLIMGHSFPALALLVAVAGLACLTAGSPLVRQRGLGWASTRASAWAPFALLLALALTLQTRPSEYVVGGRDPGTYVAAMGLIARTGGIIYTDPLVRSIPSEDVALFYRNPDSPDFNWGRFMGFPLENPRSARVFPEFFHLFPVFGAFLFQAVGVKGALAAPCVFGVLGTLACFLALRRVLGTVAATLGAGLLGLNVLQVWFARYPLSEPMSQFLLFSGVLALALWEEKGSGIFGLCAGGAFGLSLLVRVDSLLILVPILLYLGIRRWREEVSWRQSLAFVLPFAALAAHAALHAALWSKKYVASIFDRPYWRHSVLVWVVAVAAALGAFVLSDLVAPRAATWLRRHGRTLRLALAVVVVAASLYAYFVRPVLSAWAGADGNDPSRTLSSPDWLWALGFRRLAAHDAQSLVRLGWFVHPLGLGLAVCGLARLLWRAERRHLFILLATLSFSAFYFYKLRVWNDYFFAARRFLPMILPCALAFAAYALVELGRARAWRRGLALILGLALAGVYARDTARIVRHVDWRGMTRFIATEAGRFAPDSVVIFEQHHSIHLLSLPLWALHGVPILELARWDPDPAQLEHAVRAWRRAGREVYFVYTYRAERGLCGLFLQHLRDVAFATSEWERSYSGPPTTSTPQTFRYKVARVVVPEELSVPALATLDVGGSDEFQVSGFFSKEGGGERSYRWTGPCATLLLPALPDAGAIVLVASAGLRPTPTVVEVSLGEVSVGRFVATADWAEHRLELPRPGPATNLLRLSVSTWRPMNADPASDDTRDLGVMIDRVRLVPRARQGGPR